MVVVPGSMPLFLAVDAVLRLLIDASFAADVRLRCCRPALFWILRPVSVLGKAEKLVIVIS